jgi:hypothetical protein
MILVILNLSAYEDGTKCSETSAYNIQKPGNYTEGSIILRSSIVLFIITKSGKYPAAHKFAKCLYEEKHIHRSLDIGLCPSFNVGIRPVEVLKMSMKKDFSVENYLNNPALNFGMCVCVCVCVCVCLFVVLFQ